MIYEGNIKLLDCKSVIKNHTFKNMISYHILSEATSEEAI